MNIHVKEVSLLNLMSKEKKKGKKGKSEFRYEINKGV